MTRFTNHKPKI